MKRNINKGETPPVGNRRVSDHPHQSNHESREIQISRPGNPVTTEARDIQRFIANVMRISIRRIDKACGHEIG